MNIQPVTAAAKQCGDVHPDTIRRMGARGEIQTYRIGRRVMVDVDEILAHAAAAGNVAIRQAVAA